MEQGHLAYGTGTTRTSAVTLHLGSHCPDGLENIFDVTRCTNALDKFDADVAKLRASIGNPILKIETREDWPPGCYMCSNTPDCSKASAQAINYAQPTATLQACMMTNWPACRMGHI